MNKERLCEAFCGELQLHDVPAGFAVKTAFTMSGGDALGFYITRSPSETNMWRLEDAGLLIPGLEASGVNLETGQRAESFSRLLIEHGARYDSGSMELRSAYVAENDLPREAMRFISLIMRVQDLELMDSSIVERAFQDDAHRSISSFFEGLAKVQFRTEAPEDADDFTADALVSRDGFPSLAIYYGTRDGRVDEAVIRSMDRRERKRHEKVALLFETVNPSGVTKRILQRALNRVDGAAYYSNDVDAAMARLGDLMGVERSASV